MFMAVHKSIQKKLEAVGNEVARMLLEDSASFTFDKAAELLFDAIPLDQFVHHALCSERHDHEMVVALMNTLRSEMYAKTVTNQIAILGGSLDAYNIIVSHLDGKLRDSTLTSYGNERLLESLRELLIDNGRNIRGVKFPIWSNVAGIIFENMVAAGVSPKAIIDDMNPVELAAASEAIARHGWTVLPTGLVPKFPMEPFSKYTVDQLLPLYEFLSMRDGAYQAQIKLEDLMMGDNIGLKPVFLLPKDVAFIVKNDPSGFIQKAASSDYMAKPLHRVIGAYRNANLLSEFDNLPKQAMNKLLKGAYLTIADLESLPESSKHLSRQKLEFDMGI